MAHSVSASLWRWVLGVIYLVALAMLLIGTFGLFGQERDPLAGVFLIPLAVPWVLGFNVLSEYLLPWATALAPLLNLLILAAVCRYLQSGRVRKI
ncbi:MAG: hypothetical protein AAGF94_15760 [Pseudomonadota bacterium]